MMKINIICENDGWIYGKFVDMFRKYSKHDILINVKDKCAVTHYLPYYLCPKNISHPCTAWLSHMEKRPDLRSKFINVAKSVDISLCHSKKYTDLLKNKYGITCAKQIIPGVDLGAFRQRSYQRPKSDKLIVGYIGRQYTSSDRKNPKLLKQISELPFVEFRTTGGKIREKDIPKFYSELDITVSPAVIEGGPMAVQESLAVGVPVLCFKSVGVADEFSHGVIKVPFGDSKNFLSRLETIWQTKSYLTWREAGRMNLMREQVKNQTWERFVRLHDSVWESL